MRFNALLATYLHVLVELNHDSLHVNNYIVSQCPVYYNYYMIFYGSPSWGSLYLCHSVGREFTNFIVARVGKWSEVPCSREQQ